MAAKMYGYVRVSTKQQNEARQVIAMHEHGLTDEYIFIEKQSGKDFDRPQYQKLLQKLSPGDTVVVHSLDRLGRNYVEIQEEWRKLQREKNVNIIVLDMPILCTNENQELIQMVITDLMLQLISFVCQSERELIRERQRQGIDAAQARGVKFGRPAADVTPDRFREIAGQWQTGGITSKAAAEALGFSRSTFFRRAREAGLYFDGYKRTQPAGVDGPVQQHEQ